MDTFRTMFSRWWTVLTILALIPLLWWSARFLTEYTNIPNSNFYKIWLSSHLVLQGEDPYAPEIWAGYHQEAGSTWVPEKAFLYPLPLSVLLTPIGGMPVEAGYVVWAFLSLLICATVLLWQVNQWDIPSYKVLIIPMLVAFFAFVPTLQTAGKGTIGGLLLLSIAVAIAFFDKSKSFIAGVSLSFLMFKPQLAISILFFIFLWMVLRKDWRGIAGLATGSVLIFFVGLIADPLWAFKFVESSQHKLGLTFGTQPTFFSAAALMCSGNETCTLSLGGFLILALLGGTAYILFRSARKISVLEVFNLSILAGVLCTPYLWSYDHVLLLIPLTWLTYEITIRTKTFVLPIIFLFIIDVMAAIGFFLQSSRPEKDFWSILVPLIVLSFVFIFTLRPYTKAPHPQPQA